MSESTSKSVECPLCGEEFDPTAAGGWCTNSECGEWQYDGKVETTDEKEETPAEGENDPTDDSLFGDDTDETAAEGTDAGSASDEHESVSDLGETEEPELDLDDEDDETEEADAEVDDEETGEPELDLDDELDEGDGVDDAEVDEAQEAEDTLDACPECDTAVGPSDAFCPSCGEDLDAHRGSDEEEADEAELDACPSCGDDVGPEDAFCVSCGEDLDAHRGDDEEELDACPSCGEDVEPDDAFCAGCGEDLDAHRGGDVDESAGETAPSTLALSAYGRSVVVGDDETVGRQIRSLLAEAGKNEDQAVRIHREHVRFVRENEQFYVVDLGENPTEVNGVRMSKGDREPIGPGGELTLSDVVTLDVEAP
jgi:hypothetical protein